MAETAESIRADALKELERGNAIRKNGSNDPLWPDGVNLNLVRNHIIYANRHLKKLYSAPVQLSMFGGCEKLLDDGSGNLVPLPPEVPNDFMARKSEILQGAKKAISSIGGVDCRLNVENECKAGGGYEAWEPMTTAKLKPSRSERFLKWSAIVLVWCAYPVVIYKLFLLVFGR